MPEAKPWKPPEGAVEPEKAEFWKPDVAPGSGNGETVVGVIKRFFDTRYGVSFILAPVVVHAADGSARGYAEIAVGMNSWLSKVIDRTRHEGSPVAIQYLGKKKTPEGAMRVFKVFELPVKAWEAERQKHLEGFDAPVAQSPDDDEYYHDDEDAPPF